jgi:hypothetical protein
MAVELKISDLTIYETPDIDHLDTAGLADQLDGLAAVPLLSVPPMPFLRRCHFTCLLSGAVLGAIPFLFFAIPFISFEFSFFVQYDGTSKEVFF